MKTKIVKIIIVITAIIGWLGAASTVEAVIKKAGNIEVVTDEPLFPDSIIWYPGLAVEKNFQVKNRGRGAKTAQIKAENGIQVGRLAEILTVRINQGNKGIYGTNETKTLRNFFDSPEVILADIFPDDNGRVFSLLISMPSSAGNEYRGASAKFDLRIGFAGEGSSSVTVAGGGESSGVLGKSGERQETEMIEGEREEEREGKEGKEELGISGESGRSEKSEEGEVAGISEEGINWKFLAIIGGLLASAGLAGWMWLRLSRNRVY